MSYRTPAYETDSANTGLVSWGGAGNYYSYSSGTFTVLRAGTGRIKGQLISWAGGESVAGLAADKGYLIGYSATNTLVAIDISTLESSDKKTLVSNYLSTYTNNVILFGIWTDGANPQIVKEDHEFRFPTEASVNEHFRLGHTFNFSGAQLSVLSSANRTIQTVGEDMLNDHGLETRVPDATGVALDAMTVFQNGSGVAKSLNRRTFTVSGITTAPTAGAVYSNNSSQFTVLYTSLTGVAPNISGTLQCWTSSGSNNPLASGTLTKVSGTGDATITYSAYAVPVTITTIYAPAGVPTALATNGATRYGIVAIYASKDDKQTPNTTNPTPKYFQVLSNTAYNSAANAANSIGTGLSPDLTQFTVPNELKAIELVLNGFVLLDGSTRIIPATTTNGFVNGVRTFKSVIGSTYSQGAVSTAAAVNVSEDTTNFNGNLSSLDINAQVMADTIDDIPMLKGRNYLNQWSTCVCPLGTIDTGVSFAAGQTRTNPGNWACTDSSKLTIAQTTTNPLDGVYSYVLTNGGAGAASVQTPLFTLGLVDVGTAQTIRFDISGITASGDYDIVLDRYNSSNVYQEAITCAGTASSGTPASALLPTGTGRFASFAITGSTATDKYALRFRRLSVSDTASPKIDELYIGPNVQVQGSAIGAWKTYVPATLTGFSSAPTSLFKYREVGDSIEIMGHVVKGATTYNAALSFSIPTGMTIDTTKTAATAWSVLGHVNAEIMTGNYHGILFQSTSSNTTLVVYGDSGLAAWSGATNVPSASANIATFDFRATVPVNELSSNVTLANRAVEEFASNSKSDNTATDTTSFAYGPGGSLIPNGAAGTEYLRNVRFNSTIQATDVLIVEFDRGSSGSSWYPATGIAPYIAQGSNSYGIVLANVSAVECSVAFRAGGTTPSGATYGSNGAAWSGLSSWRWRVRKVSGGASVGYPISSANIVHDTTAGKLLVSKTGGTTEFSSTISAATEFSNLLNGSNTTDATEGSSGAAIYTAGGIRSLKSIIAKDAVYAYKTGGVTTCGKEAGDTFTLGDDATVTYTKTGYCGLVMLYSNSGGQCGLYFVPLNGTTVVLLSDPDNSFSASDTDGRFCLFKTGAGASFIVKNRSGSSATFKMIVIGTSVS